MTQSVTDLDGSPSDSDIVDTNQLVEITSEFLDSMLGIEVTSVNDDCETPDFDSSAWRATIQIEGSTNAEVETICCGDFASRIASSMFSMEASELTDEELADSMGEVVNIIGGNVKGMIGQDYSLHLPRVDSFSEADRGSANGRLVFECDGGYLTVSVARVQSLEGMTS